MWHPTHHYPNCAAVTSPKPSALAKIPAIAADCDGAVVDPVVVDPVVVDPVVVDPRTPIATSRGYCMLPTCSVVRRRRSVAALPGIYAKQPEKEFSDSSDALDFVQDERPCSQPTFNTPSGLKKFSRSIRIFKMATAPRYLRQVDPQSSMNPVTFQGHRPVGRASSQPATGPTPSAPQLFLRSLLGYPFLQSAPL